MHYVNASSHLITQTLRVVPAALLPPHPHFQDVRGSASATPSVTASPKVGPIAGAPVVGQLSLGLPLNLPNLPPIPNPFKQFKARHGAASAPGLATDAQPGRIELGERRDLGDVRAEIGTAGTVTGARMTSVRGCIVGAVWFADGCFVRTASAKRERLM